MEPLERVLFSNELYPSKHTFCITVSTIDIKSGNTLIDRILISDITKIQLKKVVFKPVEITIQQKNISKSFVFKSHSVAKTIKFFLNQQIKLVINSLDINIPFYIYFLFVFKEPRKNVILYSNISN